MILAQWSFAECSVARQMYTALLRQMAVLLGFAYFFTTHVT